MLQIVLILVCKSYILEVLGMVTDQNVEKPKRGQPKHRQTEMSTDWNLNRQKRR